MRLPTRSAFRYAALALFAPLVLGASCMAPPEPPPETDAPVATAESPIVNGQPDTTHTAVVAVLSNNSSCTGTIIQVKNGQGYVLTAAHCCEPGNQPNTIVIGNNYNNGQNFGVVNGSVRADSCYGDCPGSTNDVCMLRFNGASGSTPVIPVMTPQNDNLSVGTSITYVGYGLTSSPNGFNSTRRRVTKTIGFLDPYFVHYADPGASGTCGGDSGGPGLVMVNGVEHVAAVTSFGDQNCTQLGASIRSRSVYTNFIAPYLADQPSIAGSCPVESDCNICIDDSTNPQCGGGCTNSLNACLNNSQCAGLIDCYGGCSTTACENDCNAQFIGGLQEYERVLECICESPCESACGTNLFCTSNRCGTKPSGATVECKACVESECCEETFACHDSLDCKKCFLSTAGPECAMNQLAIGYYQCVEQNCGSVCTLKDPTMIAAAASTAEATVGVGGAGGGGGATPSATTGAGGKEPTTVTECACQTPGAGDVSSWPWIASAIGFGLVVARRRRSRPTR